MPVSVVDLPVVMLARSLMHNGGLIFRLAQREVLGRYRGSLIGLAWSLLHPLLMLAVYTFVFSEIFQARWGIDENGKGMFALALFSGLIVYTFFAECSIKAPGLLLQNPSYITKIVFPLEILAVVSVLSTMFNAIASLFVLALFILLLRGEIPATFPYTFVLLFPLAIFCLGMTWFLSALGIYLRDLGLIVNPLTTALMFLSPVLYPLTQVPERWRGWVEANPLTFFIESARGAALMGQAPDMRALALWVATAVVVAIIGHMLFSKARRGFADVL